MKRIFNTSWMASILLGLAFVLSWYGLTEYGASGPSQELSEYDRLSGKASMTERAGVPGPIAVLKRSQEIFSEPFKRESENNLGIAWHLLDSVKRVLSGYGLAVLIGVPLGFAIGLVPWLSRAMDPYIQILRPVSPMAWMPLALYTLKDSSASAVFIIFICSLWPVMINTSYATSNVRQDWVNVGKVFGLTHWETIRRIILPASVPMIFTGMRISIGIAWLVIVAAEMVAGQSGIGFFVWNEWNNMQVASIIVAIVLIGAVGFALDQTLAAIMKKMSFRE